MTEPIVITTTPESPVELIAEKPKFWTKKKIVITIAAVAAVAGAAYFLSRNQDDSETESIWTLEAPEIATPQSETPAE